jgi:oxygen-independent coproporphyrinogen III oxidase
MKSKSPWKKTFPKIRRFSINSVSHHEGTTGEGTMATLGLYIHVPFCRSRCHFCAFYLQIYREDRARDYLTALFHEIELHAKQQTLGGRRLDTVYFGGGTPTALQSLDLCEILSCVQAGFGLQPDAEITVEAHPDTVTVDGLIQLTTAGFNRISFGVQSLDDDELADMGRVLLPDSTRTAVASARETGFNNISLDLIFGLSGQTLESWQSTLAEAIALNPTHLSCYALTVEEGTRLIVDIRRGDRTNPEDALQNAMEDEAVKQLTAAGFTRYEISNYCRPGNACRHNILYWKDGKYLGLGPSAQSYVSGARFGNVEDLKAYQDMLTRGCLPIAEREQLDHKQRHREALVFGLRLIEGIPIESIHAHKLGADCEVKIALLLNEGWLEKTGGRIKLTAAGRRFADSVAVELL